MIIDLSVPLETNMPTYPGDPTLQIEQTSSLPEDGYLGHSVRLGTHAGTHIDAPAHMLEGAPTMGQLPLDTFAGPGKLIRGLAIETLKVADIRAGDIVLFDTGTAGRFYEASYFTEYPVLSEAMARYLVASQVKMVGLDAPSADNDEGFPIHKILLGSGIPIIENLTNLTALEHEQFNVYAVPLKLDLDGAPVRAFAEVRRA